MKLCFKFVALLISAIAVYSVIGCSAPAGFSYQNVSVSLSVECGDCPTIIYNPAYPAPSVVGQPAPPGSVVTQPATGQGGVYIFTAHVTNAPANVTWNLYPNPNLSDPTSPTGTSTPVGESGSQVGTIAVASGNTVYYTQNGVPVYSGAALQQAQAMGIPQGMVLLTATVPADPNDPSKVVTASQLIQIFGGNASSLGPPTAYLVPRTPTTPSGITTPVITVPRGTSYQFYGGIVGAAPCTNAADCLKAGPTAPINTVDNSAVWEVGPSPFNLGTAVQCTTPALCPYGTITSTGLYTAPATPPAITPVVVLVSHLVPTVNAYAYVGVQ